MISYKCDSLNGNHDIGSTSNIENACQNEKYQSRQPGPPNKISLNQLKVCALCTRVNLLL